MNFEQFKELNITNPIDVTALTETIARAAVDRVWSEVPAAGPFQLRTSTALPEGVAVFAHEGRIIAVMDVDGIPAPQFDADRARQAAIAKGMTPGACRFKGFMEGAEWNATSSRAQEAVESPSIPTWRIPNIRPASGIFLKLAVFRPGRDSAFGEFKSKVCDSVDDALADLGLSRRQKPATSVSPESPQTSSNESEWIEELESLVADAYQWQYGRIYAAGSPWLSWLDRANGALRHGKVTPSPITAKPESPQATPTTMSGGTNQITLTEVCTDCPECGHETWYSVQNPSVEFQDKTGRKHRVSELQLTLMPKPEITKSAELKEGYIVSALEARIEELEAKLARLASERS